MISARKDDDKINGGGGDDIICGGQGREIIEGEAGSDLISADKDDDKVWGGPGDPTGTLLASAGDDLILRLWDPATGDPVGGIYRGHRDSIQAGTFNPDGDLVATVSAAGDLGLWHLSEGTN